MKCPKVRKPADLTDVREKNWDNLQKCRNIRCGRSNGRRNPLCNDSRSESNNNEVYKQSAITTDGVELIQN